MWWINFFFLQSTILLTINMLKFVIMQSTKRLHDNGQQYVSKMFSSYKNQFLQQRKQYHFYSNCNDVVNPFCENIFPCLYRWPISVSNVFISMFTLSHQNIYFEIVTKRTLIFHRWIHISLLKSQYYRQLK